MIVCRQLLLSAVSEVRELMLSELNVVGKWFQDESAEGWLFDEITFDSEVKQAFEQLNLDIQVYKHSARVNVGNNHTYVPGHYFLYALKLQPLVTLLLKYIDVFGVLRADFEKAEDIANLIQESSPSYAVTDAMDSFSRENFYGVFGDKGKRLKGKSIVNGQGTGTSIRSNEDFICSVILKALPVPDVSSDMLAKIIYSFSQNTEALKVLKRKYYAAIPYQFKSESGDELLFKVMSVLGWEGKLDSLFESVGADIEKLDWSQVKDAFRLSRTKVDSNHLYFNEPVHYVSEINKYVYLKKGLLDTGETQTIVNSLLSSLWPELLVFSENSEFVFRSPLRLVEKAERLTGGENKIVYGAPGTGKSYRILQETEKAGIRKIVTVFHPDTQYSDFVGSLRPQTHRGANGQTAVTYEYRPGPFVSALVQAENNPSDKVCLVIEEINRAPAAAVFGELFQLLDRNRNGESTYGIEVSDPDMQEYLREHTGSSVSELKLPSNLSIYATMNSSDQAVMPLDTAFKRRWSFEYIRLSYENAPGQELKIMTTDGVYKITWADFADKVVNKQLKEFRVAEDRLVGPYFLNDTELSDARSALCGKLFLYLWDDVLRHRLQERSRLFNEDLSTYGDLYDRFMQENSGKTVFSVEADELIRHHGRKVQLADDSI